MRRSFAMLAVALSLSACTSQRSHSVLSLAGNDLESAETESSALVAACPATVWVADESVKSRPLNTLDEQAVQAMARSVLDGSGPEVHLGHQGDGVQVTIKRAYIHPLTTSKSAVVVVSVTREDGAQPALFRGRYVGLNWWGTDSEFQAALTRALEQALTPLREQLLEVCAPAAEA